MGTMSEQIKCKLLVHLLNFFGIPPNMEESIESLQKEYENVKALDSLIEIFNIFNGPLAVQRFDCFTLKAPKSKGSVFKFVNERLLSSLYMCGQSDYALGLGKNIKNLETMQFVGSFVAMSVASSRCAAI